MTLAFAGSVSMCTTNEVSVTWKPASESPREDARDGLSLSGNRAPAAFSAGAHSSGNEIPLTAPGPLDAGAPERDGDLLNNSTREEGKGGPETSSNDSPNKEFVVEVGWWDILMLVLLALLALSSSAALVAGSYIGDLGRRSCQAWGPLRRFMKLRNRSNVKLQMFVSQYERVSQERARIAVSSKAFERPTAAHFPAEYTHCISFSA